ncbi:unnamed protein product, partial [Owenia fusiformis]
AGCKIAGFLTSVCCIGSALSLASISMDRYQAIINCFEYTSRSSIKYITKVVIWIWTQAVICSTLPLLGWGNIDYRKFRYICSIDWTYHLSYAIFMLVTCFAFPLMVITYCYVKIIKVARQHARRIADISIQLTRDQHNSPTTGTNSGALALAMLDPIARISMFNSTHSGENFSQVDHEENSVASNADFDHDTTSTTSNVGQSNTKKSLKATLRLFALILVYLICWFPYVVVSMKTTIDNHTGHDPSTPEIHAIATWLLLMNSAINPYIYTMTNKRFRHTLKRMLRGQKKRKRVKNTRFREADTRHHSMASNATITTKTTRSSSAFSAASDSAYRNSICTSEITQDSYISDLRQVEADLAPLPKRGGSVSMTNSSGQFLEVPKLNYGGVDLDTLTYDKARSQSITAESSLLVDLHAMRALHEKKHTSRRVSADPVLAPSRVRLESIDEDSEPSPTKQNPIAQSTCVLTDLI